MEFLDWLSTIVLRVIKNSPKARQNYACRYKNEAAATTIKIDIATAPSLCFRSIHLVQIPHEHGGHLSAGGLTIGVEDAVTLAGEDALLHGPA